MKSHYVTFGRVSSERSRTIVPDNHLCRNLYSRMCKFLNLQRFSLPLYIECVFFKAARSINSNNSVSNYENWNKTQLVWHSTTGFCETQEVEEIIQ